MYASHRTRVIPAVVHPPAPGGRQDGAGPAREGRGKTIRLDASK